MASRFGSSLQARDSRNDLFNGYTGGASSAGRAASPYGERRYGYLGGGCASATMTATAYGGSRLDNGSSSRAPQGAAGYRSATPNSRGQYSNAVYDELESQNDDAAIEGILGKVRVLKSMTMAIGDEIRDSSAMADKMNDAFDGTRLRLRGTVNRMLIMAERTGVGWKVWLGFIALVILLFTYVWLF